MENVELEYRVEIPLENFDVVCELISKKGQTKSHKKRFSVMVFLDGQDTSSILYIRTTKDQKTGSVDSEIVHKKGVQHTHDRIEITQKVDSQDFESYIKLLGSLASRKTLVMQRETLNIDLSVNIVTSVVKAKNYAYIEFEKMCNQEEKQRTSEELLGLIRNLGFEPLNKDTSMDLSDRLDKNDDRLISGSSEEIESVIKEYREFLK